MDEGKLEELFNDAASAPPAASFDADDVARGSRRVTARRRTGFAGGSLVAAAVLVGGVGMGTGLFDDPSRPVASPPVTPSQAQPQTQGQPKIGIEGTPKSNGPGVMSLPGDRSCSTPDAQLAKSLSGELPEATGSPPSTSPCAPGARSASFTLRDADASGRITVLLSPAGTTAPDQAAPGERRDPDGTEQVVRKAHSGRILTVVSDPDAGSAAPYGARLIPIADALAPQF